MSCAAVENTIHTKTEMAFMETSALDSTNIDLAFQKLIEGLAGLPFLLVFVTWFAEENNVRNTKNIIDIHQVGGKGQVVEAIEPGKRVQAGRKLNDTPSQEDALKEKLKSKRCCY